MSIPDVVRGFVALGDERTGKGDTMQTMAVDEFGLVTVLLPAALFRVARGEFQTPPMNVVLGGLAAFVARGRFEKAPVAP